MNRNQENDLLKQELHLVHSIMERIHFNMDSFELIDEIIHTLLTHIPFRLANIGIINENDKLVIHNIFERLYPDASKDLQAFIRPVFGIEIDYHNNPMWLSQAVHEDKEFYYPEVVFEKMPEETKIYFSLSGNKAVFITPLKLGSQIYGVIFLTDNEKPVFLSEEEKSYIRRSGSLIAKVIENNMIYKKIEKQNQQFENETILAGKIQKDFLPKKLPFHPKVKLVSEYLPMKNVGGDYYDFIYPDPKENGKFGFLIADVSGHGVPAAFITSMIKMVFQSDVVKNNASNPVKVLEEINRSILDKTSGNFVTAFYAFIDLDKKTILFSSAGHNPYFMLSQKNGVCREFSTKGRFLGVFDQIKLEAQEIKLNEYDRLFFYTDGLTEAADQNFVFFEENLYQIFNTSYHLPIKEFSAHILSELKKHALFGNKKELDDDMAFVIMDIF